MKTIQPLEAILQLYGSRVCCQAQVVVIAVKLRVVSFATRVLIHGLQLQVTALEEIVKAHSRHV